MQISKEIHARLIGDSVCEWIVSVIDWEPVQCVHLLAQRQLQWRPGPVWLEKLMTGCCA